MDGCRMPAVRAVDSNDLGEKIVGKKVFFLGSRVTNFLPVCFLSFFISFFLSFIFFTSLHLHLLRLMMYSTEYNTEIL